MAPRPVPSIRHRVLLAELPEQGVTLSFPAGDGLPYLLWETGHPDTLPGDWSAYGAFEFQATNLAERMVYLIWRFIDHGRYIRGGPLGRERGYNVLVGLLPGVTATVPIPLACLDGGGRFSLRPPGTGVVYTWGQGVDPTHLTAIRLYAQALARTGDPSRPL